ncbi:MAG: DNA-binding protein [Silvibacterium sp.]|nr:DNA-binding protein [Silvibacterium sp.]
MNRKDLQALANIRLREARALYRAGEFSGAYYLIGYAVECGFKTCIAKRVRKHDFPDKKAANEAHTHKLKTLCSLADLDSPRLLLEQADPFFRKNWNLTITWSEESRYKVFDKQKCQDLMDAIMERSHGVMPWIKQYW